VQLTYFNSLYYNAGGTVQGASTSKAEWQYAIYSPFNFGQDSMHLWAIKLWKTGADLLQMRWLSWHRNTEVINT